MQWVVGCDMLQWVVGWLVVWLTGGDEEAHGI